MYATEQYYTTNERKSQPLRTLFLKNQAARFAVGEPFNFTEGDTSIAGEKNVTAACRGNPDLSADFSVTVAGRSPPIPKRKADRNRSAFLVFARSEPDVVVVGRGQILAVEVRVV